MRKIQLLTIITALTAAAGALAQVPSIINYQGRLSAGGASLFNGPGQFKFALVNGGTNLSRQATAVATVSGGYLTIITVTDGGHGYGETPGVTMTDATGSNAIAIAHLTAGVVTSITVPAPGSDYSPSPTVTIAPPPPTYAYVTFWSNDGSSAAGAEPGQAVTLLVNQGLFSVNLGDTGLSNMTAVIPPSTFINSDVWLRIWFSDGVVPFQQFYPDQRLAAAGYAMMAANVADGSITSPKLAPGAVSTTAVAVNAIGTPNIVDGSITSAKLAPGAVGSSAVAANAITNTNIVDGTITSSKLAPGLVSGVPNGMAVFTSSGTWTRPAGVTRVHVKLWGGGGGGSGGTPSAAGSGGGGGGYCEGLITVTSDVSVTVGGGGAGGGPGGAGANGANSSVLSLSANGGGGGSPGANGNSGSASGGSLNVTGNSGGVENGYFWSGGNAAFGGGGGGLTSAAEHGGFPGGGSGGTAGGPGNPGGQGVAIVYY